MIVDREQEALALIQELYKTEYVEDTLRDIQTELKRSQQEDSDSVVTTNSTLQPDRTGRLRLWVGVDVAFLQQMCGINVAVLYGSEISHQLWGDLQTAKWIQIGIMSIQLLGCALVLYYLAKIGRKALLQLGTASSCLLSGVMAVDYWIEGPNPTRWIILGALLLYMFSFGFTLGPVAWLYPP